MRGLPAPAGWALSLAIAFAGPLPGRAERAPDPWQSFMDAAAAAVAEEDDGAARIAFEAAIAITVPADPAGPRSRLAYVEAAFAHGLMGEADQATRDLAAVKATRDLVPDESLIPFAATAKAFGDAYLARFERAGGADAARASLLVGGAEFNYDARVRILRALRPEATDALAQALLDQGKSDYAGKKHDLAIRALEEAVSLADALQARRRKLREASRALSPAATGSKSMPSDLETDVGGAVAFEARDELVQVYVAKGWLVALSAPAKAKEALRRGIATAQDLLARYPEQLVGGGRDALLQTSLASASRALCEIAAREQASRETCAADGAAHYERALALFGEREGEKAANAFSVAVDFARFLREQDQELRAEAIEQRYGVTYRDEATDYGVAVPPGPAPADARKGPTPTTLPGGEVVLTREMFAALRAHRLRDRPFLLVHVAADDKPATLPGALRLRVEGAASEEEARARLKAVLEKADGGDRSAPVVFFGAGVQDWAPYDAALRAQTLGYSAVYWFRGGMDAWTDASGPVAASTP